MSWSASAKIATVKRGQDILEIPAGGNIAKRNEQDIVLDMPAKVVDGRVFCTITFCRGTVRIKCCLG